MPFPAPFHKKVHHFLHFSTGAQVLPEWSSDQQNCKHLRSSRSDLQQITCQALPVCRVSCVSHDITNLDSRRCSRLQTQLAKMGSKVRNMDLKTSSQVKAKGQSRRRPPGGHQHAVGTFIFLKTQPNLTEISALESN